MSTRTVEQVDSWDTVSFSGGYSGLQDLAESEFSGVVIAGPARLFMLRGTVVGILDGSIGDFEDASATARAAPHPGLPLLAVMQERSDEVRAKYYTEDTPLQEVDQTLSSGGFTGYIELSENVLSGDYYQIYHQGRSMSAAWVGNSSNLITEDEAFEQANDEVGIYEVRPVDIDVVEIPEPSSSSDGASTGSTDSGDTAASTGGDTTTADETNDDEARTDDPAPSGTDEGADESVRTGTSGGDPIAKTATERTTDTRHKSTPDDATARDEHTAEQTSSTDSSESRTGTDRSSRENDGSEPIAEAESSSRASDTQQTDATGKGRPNDVRQESSGTDARSSSASASTDATPSGESTGRRPEQAEPRSSGTGSESTEGTGGSSRSSKSTSPEDAGDLEMRSIPSLDPGHTAAASKESTSNTGSRGASAETKQRSESKRPSESRTEQTTRQSESTPREGRQRSSERDEATTPTQPQPSSADSGTPQERTGDAGNRGGELRSELEASRKRVAELETALEESETDREQLREERDTLATERDELERELEDARAEIERLETRLEEMAADDGMPDAETRLSSGEAIDQTNLFVRYRSKGDATLESVHTGNATRSEVDENMRLEYHTQFEAEEAAVGGETFDEFLTNSIQYRFVDWVVRSLLFEIRDTGHPDSMKGLYDALPKIDRAELNGQISVQYTEDGEEQRSQERFDVVVRDRMGNPLMVANINDSRDPATEGMMTDLITRAERVGSSSETLAGAFLVTESFFEPPALETAEEATSSGLFSRDKRKSFVNLSRKDGYHLCLVEARNQEFHLAVPEL